VRIGSLVSATAKLNARRQRIRADSRKTDQFYTLRVIYKKHRNRRNNRTIWHTLCEISRVRYVTSSVTLSVLCLLLCDSDPRFRPAVAGKRRFYRKRSGRRSHGIQAFFASSSNKKPKIHYRHATSSHRFCKKWLVLNRKYQQLCF